MNDVQTLFRLIEMTDSAFPVGGFAFSSGIETAAETGLVHDAATLDAFVRDSVRSTALCDGVAALCAYRSCMDSDYDAIRLADRSVICAKASAEARLMSLRMGRKFAEIAIRITDGAVVKRWFDDILAERTFGTYPVTGAVIFAQTGVSEVQMFASQAYGAASVMLNAALRTVRVSHYDTQRIMFSLGAFVDELYDRASESSLDDMMTFVPTADIMASMHEKGTKRMFMN